MPKGSPKRKLYSAPVGFHAVVSAIALSLCIIFFLKWRGSASLWHLALFSCFAVVLIAFSKPLIDARKVSVENGNITLYHRFSKPRTFSIVDSLYAIVTKNDEVRSFRFRVGWKHIQVSPVVYKDGGEMTAKILAVLKKKKMVVKIICR